MINATAIDTETPLVTVLEPVPRVVSIAAAGPVATGLWHHSDPAARDVFVAALDAGITLANAPFDMLSCARQWPETWPHILAAYRDGRVSDVLTDDRAIVIATGEFEKKFDLGSVAWRRCGIVVDKSDPWRLRYEELIDVPIAHWPEDAIQYAFRDATSTKAVYDAHRPYAPLLTTSIVHARAHLALYAQTVLGIRTDQAAVAALDRKLAGWLEELTRVCLGAGFLRHEGKRVIKLRATPARVREAVTQLCAERGVVPAVTDTGLVSTDEQALMAAGVPGLTDPIEKWLDAAGRFVGHPLDAYRRRGTIQKQRNGRVAAMRRPIIRTRYRELVDSGRTSSSAPNRKAPAKTPWWEWCGIQGQNFPRDGGFRECLVPDDGCMFVTSDIVGSELCANAHTQRFMFGRSALGDAIDRGLDVHAQFGMRMLGLPVEAYDKRNPEHKEARQGAKAYNFGKPGGLGPNSFQNFARISYGVELDLDTIRRLDALWLEQWPEMRDMFAWVNRQKSGGRFTIAHPCTGYQRGGMSYTQACNFVALQHVAAMVAKEQLWWLFLAQLNAESPLYQCPQKLFVHDEHVTQVAHGDPARCPEHTGPDCKRCEYTVERLGPGWIFPRVEAARDEQERIMNTAARVWAPLVTWRADSKMTWRYMKD